MEQLEQRQGEEQFRDAVATLQEGFALYDADDRLVLFNDEYQRLHPNVDDLLKPGMRFEELVRTNIERGMNADAIGREEEHIRERMEQHRNPTGPIIRTLTDGTSFVIKESRTPDGGVVVTETDITELKQAEEELIRQKTLFEAVFRDIPDAMVLTDTERNIIMSNPAVTRTFGYEADEILGKSTVGLYESREEYERQGRLRFHMSAEEKLEPYVVNYKRKNGEVFPGETVGTSFRDGDGSTLGFIGVIRDITDRQRADVALKESEARFRVVVDNLPSAILLKDAEGHYLIANKQFNNWFNPEGRNLLGKTSYDFVSREIADAITGQDRAVIETGTAVEREIDIPFADGTVHTTILHKFPIFGPDGRCIAVGGINTDITERTRAEKNVHRLAAAIEGLSENFALYGADDRLIVCNEGYRRLNKRIAEATTPGTLFEDHLRAMVEKRLVPEATGRVEEWLQERMERHRNPRGPFELLRQDGIWLLIHDQRMPDGSTATVSTDITERRVAEEALRDSEERLRGAIESLQEGFALFDADDRLVALNDKYRRVNPAAQRIMEQGGTFEDVIRANIDRGALVEAIGREEEFLRDRLKRHRDPGDPIIRRISDGSWYMLQEARTPEGGTALSFIGITELKEAEEALRESEERFRDVAESAGDWIWEMGPDLRFTFLSRRFFELFPVGPEKIIGKTRDEFAGATRDDDPWRRHLDDIANHRPFRGFEYPVTVPDGSTKYIRISGKPVLDNDGAFRGYRGTGTDVTAEVEAEAAAAKAQADLFDAIESITAGFALFDQDDRLVLCNSRYGELHPVLANLAKPGMSFQEIIKGVARADVYDASMGPPDAYIEKRLEYHRNTPSRHEQRFVDGRVVDIYEYSTHDGGTVLLWTDITERKLLERQLAGSQRMEALGNLTGGVAHDFNNLLTVILGNLQLLERRVGGDRRLEKYVRLASGAAQRGAELTRRLLVFARRQMLETTVFDVNGLVFGMEALLRGTLGETIHLKNILAEEPWPVRADPTQLENALLNLALNARDAMPEGGKMTIETANVTLEESYAKQNPGAVSGNYVMVAIGDTGVGMPPEILDHAFEPFFTTKEIGKGTGLGLSMVYGFVKQSDGYIKVYSEPGHGSVVKLYLPSAEGDEKVSTERLATIGEVVGGDETILVVEDDSDVRRTAVALLEELGYRVLEAEDGPSALRVLDKHSDIDLLFTDVIMPGGMRGPELAREVRQHRPGMKVLYTSGYTENGVVRNGMLEAEAILLGKPFLKSELAAKVRRVLDS